MALKSDTKFEEKLIFYFKNEKTLVNFDLNTQNSQNSHFLLELLKFAKLVL